MTQHKPRVSIGLTVYNSERYLKETLDSILDQTFSDFELIISDNASTDGTQQICETYAAKDGRLKYYRNSKNLGVAPNLNRVFELSSGEYFKWADHDDLLAPDFLSRCVAVLDSKPDVAVCFPKVKLIDKDNAYVGDYDPLPDTSSKEPHIRFRNLITAPDGRAIQTMGLIRVNLLQQTVMNGTYPSSDEVLLANLALLGHYYEIPERLLLYRIHPHQSTKGVLASERARVIFFDTSLEGQIVLLKWLYLKNCLTAIGNAPLSLKQRIFCYFHLLGWSLMRKNFRSLTKDALLAIHKRVPLFPQLHQETLDAAKQSHHYQ